MLKRFFVTLLGTVAGVWISAILAVIVGIIVVGIFMASSSDGELSVPEKSILYLNLSGSIQEKNEQADILSLLNEGLLEADTFGELLNSIYKAKDDPRIDGIYINAAGSLAGYATREELVNALRDFKTSGKWIYAYGDSYLQGDYLLASVADSVFLNPVGAVDVHGVYTQIPFYKGLLDKIGVNIRVVRVGTFKSAVEPFISTEMSEASRLQTQTMLDSIWQYYASTLAENRGVSVSEVNMWADSIMATWRPQKTLDAKAVSALRYRRNIMDMLKDKCEVEHKKDLSLIKPRDYTPIFNHDLNEEHIAVYVAAGDIVDVGDGGIVGPKVVSDIIRLADDENVRALVLRVNSGGGSGFASEQIWEALEYFKSQGKPFYVSMGDYAASGGYYISCGADRIFADKTTLTGSIGVFGLIPDLSDLATNKLGVTFSSVQTNPNAGFPNIMTPMSDFEYDALQSSIDNFYEVFTGRVAQGRDIPQDSVKSIAEGRVWVGGDALKIGLVDEIGGLHDAISSISKLAGIDEDKVAYYPKQNESMLVSVVKTLNSEEKNSYVTFDNYAQNVIMLLRYISSMNPIQAHMPYFIFQ